MAQATTTTSDDKEKQEQKVEVEFFHIDMIPDAMDKMKWPVAAKLMRHWFNAKPALAFTVKTKDQYQNEKAQDIPEGVVNCDIVKMTWAIQFEQVIKGIAYLSGTWDSPKGRELLKKRLSQKGDYLKNNVSIGYTDDIRELESDITATEPPPSQRAWKPFLGGALSMLMVGSMALWGWQYIHRPDPLLVQLNASLAPQPVVLTPAQLQALQSHPPSAETVIRATQHQLTRLAQLPAGWNITYGNQLVQQVLALWPEQSASLRQQWQQQLDAIALPPESLTGWHQGMEQLQRLTDRLNGLDEQHGKYMTVSELKSQVFALTQSFSQTPPVEEQLRQMQQSGVSPALAQQAQMHLNQLLTRYTLLTDKPGNTTP
ncbi:DUF6402 family protein [Lelliottia amnigena]|uniref:DUF6402 family protein n=1 Tax=Lelliottia amnigena TaxID=61646 RepID=UPI002430F4DE|nr:DUF6402 family protein [Lelliottia amnigena]